MWCDWPLSQPHETCQSSWGSGSDFCWQENLRKNFCKRDFVIVVSGKHLGVVVFRCAKRMYMIVGCWCQILLFEIYRVSCQILDVICAFNYQNGWPNSNQIDVKSSGVQASCFQIFWCNIQNIPQICF